MADIPSDAPSQEEIKETLNKIHELTLKINSDKLSGIDVQGLVDQRKVLWKQVPKQKKKRGKSTDSRASGTTVGTTHTHDQIIHGWNKKIQQLSDELSTFQSESGNEAAIKKIKKQISKIKNKIKKRKEKHNTGAATPQTVKSAAQSFLSHLTAAAGAIPGSTEAAVSESNVGKNGLVKAIQSKTSSAIFPLLPPPIINKTVTGCIRKYYDKFHDLDPTSAHYSYNPCVFKTNEEDKASCECFYVKMQKTKQKKGKEMKVNHNYVAYVKNAEYLSMAMDSLKNQDISGVVYVSVSCLYKKDDKQHVGFITFLIPFSKKISDVTVTGNTVCAIETDIKHPASEPSTLKEFITAYGSYIYASNIALDDYDHEAPNLAQNTSMTGKQIKTLVMTFKDIQNHEKTLIRTWKGFKMQDQVTVWANAKVKSGDQIAWMANIKMLLPYIRQNDINVAKDIIAKAVGQCQHAVAQYHLLHPGDSKQFFEHIWYTTVWILIAEMSKEKMNNQRIADLSTGVMQKFEEVYLRDTQFKADWRKFLEHKIPTTPVLSLENIIHSTPKQKKQSLNSSGRDPTSSIFEDGAGEEKFDETGKSQFRDW